MNNAAVICKIKNVRPHPNADRVQLGTACGYQVVVGLDVKEGDLGIYFPTDTCLGNDYAAANEELLTYFGKNLRVRTQKFRGERSEGFWAGAHTVPLSEFKEGDELTTVENVEICKKYVNPATLNRRNMASKIAKKLRAGSLPTFQKHLETEHLRKEWDTIPRDRQWIWTVKQHGTSARTSLALVEQELTWWHKALQKLGVPVATSRYEYLVGTRNVILGELRADGSVGKDSFYSDEFRRKAAEPFLGTLHKGEVVYYEIVGYAAYNSPIMPTVHPKDKDIKKLYGKEVTYTYGCANGSFDIYVYRIAYQTEDGQSIDLSWDQVKQRCGELGVKYVPEIGQDVQALWNGVDNSLDLIQDYIERPDPIDERHPMEGVVLRVEGSKPKFYKEKAFTFKVLEGIVKDAGDVDIEEAS